MIVDINLVQARPDNFQISVLKAVREYQRLGYRVEIQYGSDYTALVIARECDWVGNNS